jgi:hypothetical protein
MGIRPAQEGCSVTEDHRHAGDGSVIEVPVAAEHVAETELVASAEVEVARIQAERDIALARIAAREVPRDMEAELAAALAELDALKTAMQPAVVETPEPPPAPVAIVNEVAPEPEPSLPEPEPEHHEDKPRKSSSSGLGFW